MSESLAQYMGSTKTQNKGDCAVYYNPFKSGFWNRL